MASLENFDLEDVPRVQRAKDAVKSVIGERSRTFWIVLGVSVMVVLTIIIVKRMIARRREARFLRCAGCYHRFDNMVVNCSGKQPIAHYALPRPRTNRSCTYSMWLYVNNWYGMPKRWKNVFYKGRPLSDDCADDLQWDRIDDQCPGIWFSDVQNNIRVAAVTTVTIPSNCMSKSASTCPETFVGSSAVGSTAESGLERCIARSVTRESVQEIRILEYADAHNIPIGEWFMLTVVITQRRLEIYLDGKLWVTKVLIGLPTFNDENGYFGAGGAYQGSMSNFRYLPHALPSPMIENLYRKESKQSFRNRTADDTEY